MRGPIIVEHATNASLNANPAAAENLTFNVKADGRAIKAYFKFKIDSGSSDNVTATVKPVAHFSNGKTVIDWPIITDTKGVVFPTTGTVTNSTASTSYQFAIMVGTVFGVSEYEVKLSTDTNALASEIYILTELV